MTDKVTVFTLDGLRMEVDRAQCVFIDRSFTAARKECPTKALHGFTGGPTGTGVMMARPSEDLVLGSAVHEGLKALLWRQGEKKATAAAWNFMIEAASKGLVIQGDENLWQVLPEVAMTLVKEQAALAYMLVGAFARRKLMPFLTEFEPVESEFERCWLLGVAETGPARGKFIVVMSRLDFVSRKYEDGKMWNVSFKTIKKVEDTTRLALLSQAQQFTDGLSIQAGYDGDAPGGTITGWLMKGLKYQDKDMLRKRYTTSLIRPWIPKGRLGAISPAEIRMEYEWYDIDAMALKRLSTKTWRRMDVWDELPGGLDQWLDWLDQGLIDPERETDWLDKAVEMSKPREWNAKLARGWVLGQRRIEEQWQDQLAQLEAAREFAAANGVEAWEAERRLIPRHENSCMDFRRPCMFYKQCWGEDTPEGWVERSVKDDLDSGRFAARVPNHVDEIMEGDSDE